MVELGGGRVALIMQEGVEPALVLRGQHDVHSELLRVRNRALGRGTRRRSTRSERIRAHQCRSHWCRWCNGYGGEAQCEYGANCDSQLGSFEPTPPPSRPPHQLPAYPRTLVADRPLRPTRSTEPFEFEHKSEPMTRERRSPATPRE